MEPENLLNKYIPIIKSYWLPILLGGSGLMFLGYSLIPSVNQVETPDILFEAASTSSLQGAENTSAANRDEKQAKIIVDVAGAVEKPGVYTLDRESRVQDALIAAGGMSEDADRLLIAKNINLAGKVIDGGKIYVPFEGEDQSQNSASQVVLGTKSVALIDINHADSSALDTLPGIGPVTSEKIINYRPYNNIEELLNKKVVGTKTYDQIKDKITAN